MRPAGPRQPAAAGQFCMAMPRVRRHLLNRRLRRTSDSPLFHLHLYHGRQALSLCCFQSTPSHPALRMQHTPVHPVLSPCVPLFVYAMFTL